MAEITRKRSSRGFTIRDLLASVTGLLIAGSLLLSMAGAQRDLSQTQQCAAHLRQMGMGLVAYVNQYNSYPPNNPYPNYWTPEARDAAAGFGGWDPSIGWIITYGLGLEPPERMSNGHFNWTVLDEHQVPEVVTCPAANYSLLFDPDNPELDPYAPLETVMYQYAAFYQTSGTCRAATTVIRPATTTMTGSGGRNPIIANPSFRTTDARPTDNAVWGMPGIYVQRHAGAYPSDPDGGIESYCWIQAVHPGEVQAPGRTYYLADSREWRPISLPGQPYAASNDGWRVTSGNRIALGSRHHGVANVLYLDGHVTRDGQMHDTRWNMDYDPETNQALSDQWRASTFQGNVRIASIMNQWSVMPVLMVKGWEYFFDENGLAPR